MNEQDKVKALRECCEAKERGCNKLRQPDMAQVREGEIMTQDEVKIAIAEMEGMK